MSIVSINRVQEGEARKYAFTAVDDAVPAQPIPLASISDARLTLYNADIPEPVSPATNIINGRDAQDIKGAHNVTIHATSGRVTWLMQPADNVIVDDKKKTEVHMALFAITYSGGVFRHRVGFRVENLRKV